MASNDAPVNLKDEIQSDSKVEANQPKKKNRHRPHRKKNKSKSEDENPDTSEILKSPKNDKNGRNNHTKSDKKLRIIKNSDNSKTPTRKEEKNLEVDKILNANSLEEVKDHEIKEEIQKSLNFPIISCLKL